MSLLALMGAASPDLEKQGFLTVVFVYREYSKQQEIAPENYYDFFELFILKDFK